MTLSMLLTRCVNELRDAGAANPRLDAELLIVHALKLPRHVFLADPNREISESAAASCAPLVARRAKREPLAYITGTREFYGLDFAVDSRVLIPRPETELLVEAALGLLPKNGSMLDICTGSGAVAVAVAHERPDCSVTGSDISGGALEVARKNGDALVQGRVRFVQSDLFAAFEGVRFDVVTANPPYIDPSLEASLQTELSFEPGLALYAPDAGREIIRRIVRDVKGVLVEGGALAMEIGFDQGEFVRGLAKDARAECRIGKDLAGHDRCMIVRF